MFRSQKIDQAAAPVVEVEAEMEELDQRLKAKVHEQLDATEKGNLKGAKDILDEISRIREAISLKRVLYGRLHEKLYSIAEEEIGRAKKELPKRMDTLRAEKEKSINDFCVLIAQLERAAEFLGYGTIDIFDRIFVPIGMPGNQEEMVRLRRKIAEARKNDYREIRDFFTEEKDLLSVKFQGLTRSELGSIVKRALNRSRNERSI